VVINSPLEQSHMSYSKPFHRNYRAIIESHNSGYSNWAYVVDREYSNHPEHFTRGFLIIQDDIKELFEYIEPSDTNEKTFSYRIHELFIRTCIEVEANFKAILRENIFTPLFISGQKAGQPRPEDKWNINDYKKINKTHHLDNYFVELPIWKGLNNRYQPFKEWQNSDTLTWYQAYNQCKHNRYDNFEIASFKNLMLAYTGLFALLSSQFCTIDFNPGMDNLECQNEYYLGTFGIGDYLKIEFPTNWSDSEKYDFNWETLKKDSNKFEKIDYNAI
jgi:hypothetical protein